MIIKCNVCITNTTNYNIYSKNDHHVLKIYPKSNNWLIFKVNLIIRYLYIIERWKKLMKLLSIFIWNWKIIKMCIIYLDQIRIKLYHLHYRRPIRAWYRCLSHINNNKIKINRMKLTPPFIERDLFLMKCTLLRYLKTRINQIQKGNIK